ncbi:MAG TPA: MFS transporter [Dehalococcoidia bacterium]|nr:MFS transporter [Dehalococcoidia bacterium]
MTDFTARSGRSRSIGGVPTSVAVVAAAVAATLLGDSMLYAVMPSSPEAWTLSVPAVGVLLSANRLVRLLTNPVAAWVFNRLGSRTPFAFALVLAVLVTLAYGWATAFVVLLAARMAWGLCWSLLRLGGYWAVLNAATDDDRGLLIGWYSAIVRMGSVGGALIGALMTDAIGHRSTLTIFSVVMTLAGVSWFLATRREHGDRRRTAEDESDPRAGMMTVFADRQLLVTGLGGLITGLVFSGLVTASLGFFLREHFGDDIVMLGLAIGVTSATGMLLGLQWSLGLPLAPLLGHLSDRLGRPLVTSGGFALGASGLVLLAASHVLLMLLVGIALTFIAATALTVVLAATAGDLAPPERRSAVMSGYATFLDLGSALGPLIGLSFASLATLRGLYAAAAVVLVVAAVLSRAAFTTTDQRVAAE